MGTGSVDSDAVDWLLCRIAGCLCALPVGRVIEVMRPLPIEPLAGMPHFLCGLSIIRGLPVPVIDTGLLLSGSDTGARRFVTIMVGDRLVALAVEQVIGIRPLAARSLSLLPPLLQKTAGDAVEAVRSLDGELLLLLDAARIVPKSLFDELSSAGSPG